MKSVFIKTYGCQMNERDSEQVACMFVNAGYQLADHEKEADIVLINTCSVREKAELKALGKMGLLCARPKAKNHVVYGLMGCMCQSKGKSIFKEIPRLDLVSGTQQYHTVFQHCDKLLQKRLAHPQEDRIKRGARICATAEVTDSQNTICEHLANKAISADFVSIMQGCSMHCSYCIVPSTRGEERSRPEADILNEIQSLAQRGVKEITLLGQIVNRYGREQAPIEGKGAFVRLLEKIHEIEGIERIRFTSPHPSGFGKDLVAAYTYLPKLCSHIHFPMQSGSDRILKLMRRPYRNESYLQLLESLRAARPDMAITTDVIVGFPTETEEDFLETMAAVERIEFDNAFIFQYSRRKDTPAAEMEGQLCLRVKEERNQRLLQVVNRIAEQRNHALVGSEQEILVEKFSKTNAQRLQGRSPQNKPVIIEGGEELIGQIVKVKITECTGFTLYGSLIHPPSATA